jgi:phage repressor protein C with HTH and peptisase S24 domain
MIIPDRLVAAMHRKGLSQSELARRIGISASMVGKLARGEARGTTQMYQIARALDVTPDYLVGDVEDFGAELTTGLPSPSVDATVAELGIVRLRELDMTLGMGATYLDVPVTETMRYFDRDWLRSYTRANPTDLIFAQGVGDSMEPTIRDSDLLLIDCSRKSIDMTDKFWAIAYANCGAVKRLHPRADGGIDMLSDNPLVPVRTAYDGEMHVLGRVVAIVRKM